MRIIYPPNVKLLASSATYQPSQLTWYDAAARSERQL
jgi:hypothetical protein